MTVDDEQYQKELKQIQDDNKAYKRIRECYVCLGWGSILLFWFATNWVAALALVIALACHTALVYH